MLNFHKLLQKKPNYSITKQGLWEYTFDMICSGVVPMWLWHKYWLCQHCASYQSQNYQAHSKFLEDTLVCAPKHYIGQNMKCETSVSKVWCPTQCHSYMTLLPFPSRDILVSYGGSRFCYFRLIRLWQPCVSKLFELFFQGNSFCFASYLL